MTLEQIIKQRLDEAEKSLIESKQAELIVEKKDLPDAKEPSEEKKEEKDEVTIEPKKKVEVKKESTDDKSVSAQVSALLEAEGLSDEFKVQAVTIFEAAVADRVLSIKEDMEKEFEVQLAEATEQLNADIDGFLSEAVSQWQKDNEVAIKSNFNTQVNESFIDGLRKLITEHNVEVPEGKENALDTAMAEIEELKESSEKVMAEKAILESEVQELKCKTVLESFREKMTVVEFDRFKQLTESVKFVDPVQYEKQLNIVLENFGSTGTKKVVVSKEVIVPIVEEVKPAAPVVATNMDLYLKAMKSGTHY